MLWCCVLFSLTFVFLFITRCWWFWVGFWFGGGGLLVCLVIYVVCFSCFSLVVTSGGWFVCFAGFVWCCGLVLV